MSDLFVTTPDAARILGVSEAGVRMLVMRGELEPIERANLGKLAQLDAEHIIHAAALTTIPGIGGGQ